MRKKAENTTKRQPIVRLAGAERLRETLFPAGELRQVLLPMLAGVVTTKKLLRDWVTDFGLAAVLGLMQADAECVVGARKSARLPGRRYSRWGSTPTPFPYDGRQVVLPRPRVRTVDKRAEVELPFVRQLQGGDPMDQRVIEQILLGVSTRGFEQSLGPAPTGVRTRGAKKSRVSEMLVGETTRRMREQCSERLDALDLVAVMVMVSPSVVTPSWPPSGSPARALSTFSVAAGIRRRTRFCARSCCRTLWAAASAAAQSCSSASTAARGCAPPSTPSSARRPLSNAANSTRGETLLSTCPPPDRRPSSACSSTRTRARA